MNLDPVVAAVRRAIPDLIALYLFGSSASGQAGSESDVDLAVLARGRLEPLERWKLQEELARLCGRNVDLVELRAASTVMQKEVVAGSRVLHDADTNERARFEALVLGAYARLNDERRGIIDDARRRGSIHG